MKDLEFFENVFEEPICKFLLENSRTSLTGSYEFKRSNFHWQPELRQSSTVVLVRDIEPVLSGLLLQKLTERKIIEHREYRVINYAWTRLSYIPWHDDYRVKDAVTIFLNDVWELDWGGLFLYQNEAKEIIGYPPTFNCGLRKSRQRVACYDAR